MQLAQQHHGQQDLVIVTESVEKRLLYIPVVFIFLRIWGSIQFFFSIAVADQNQEGCIPDWIHTVFLVLGVLQVMKVSNIGMTPISLLSIHSQAPPVHAAFAVTFSKVVIHHSAIIPPTWPTSECRPSDEGCHPTPSLHLLLTVYVQRIVR